MKKLLLILLFFGVSLSAHAATITVCASGCDQTTILAAYTAASSNDVIIVSPGTYAEDHATNHNLTLSVNKNITIQSSTGTASDVVIRANSSVNNAIIHTDGNVTLQNLTIDGTGLTGSTQGAFRSTASGDNVTLTNVVFQNVSQPVYAFYVVGGTNGTVTLTNCSAPLQGIVGVGIANAVTTLNISGSTFSAQANQYHGLSIGAAVTTVTLSNSTFTAGTAGHGFQISGNITIGSMSATNVTFNGGTGSNDAFHLDTGDTITLLTLTNSTFVDNGTSGTHNALEIGGALTTLNATNSTFTAAAGGVAINGYDGTNYGTGTWIQVKDSTLTSSTSTGLLLQKNYGQVDIEGNTITCGDSTAGCVLLGTETVEAGAENDAPLGILRFVGNTVTKTGVQGHNTLFGSGSGRGVIEGNTFVGGNYGLITKWDYQEIRRNNVWMGAGVIGLYVAGGQYCKVTNNSVYTTTGTACAMDDNQLTDVAKENIFRDNICISGTGYAMNHAHNSSAEADDNQLDRNIYYSTSATPFRIQGTNYATLALYKAGWVAKYPNELFSLNEALSSFCDPRFFNPAGGDFRVPMDSCAKGTQNSSDPNVTVWNDMGAYQRYYDKERFRR